MPLTPADVANVAFSKPPLGKRGYQEDEVDAFLDLVETELARLIEENNDLRNQVEQLDQQLRTAAVNTGPRLRPVEPPRLPMAPVLPIAEQTSPGSDHNAQATRVLGLAQEMADQLKGEAKTEVEAMVSQARANSERLLYEAGAKADGLVREARNRADAMLNEARARAEALEGQCREKVASVERDAARRQTEVIASLSQEKNALEKKIDELRALEREYRTRLKTYLSSQLRSLDGGGSVASPAPIRHRRDAAAPGSGTHADAVSPDSPERFNLFAT